MMALEQLIQFQETGSDLPPDLDLIEVLWRQDVDLGVGKEDFDPNLRKELEQERELELRKEQEQHKEAERREREKRQRAEQWLSQNYVRDGETGELMPITGNNTFTTTPPANLYPEHPVTLEDALTFVGELQVNHTLSQQTHQQQQQQQQQQQESVVPVLQADHLSYGADDLQLLADSLLVEPQLTNYSQTEQDRLEQSWQEVVEQIFPLDNLTTSSPNTTSTPNTTLDHTTTTALNHTTTTTPNHTTTTTPNHTTSYTMPPLEEPSFVVSEPDWIPVSEAQVYQSPFSSSLDHMMADHNQSLSAASSMLGQNQTVSATNSLMEHNQSMSVANSMLVQNQSMSATNSLLAQNQSAASSMTETRRLLQQNSTDMGALNGLLHNVTLPLLNLDNNLTVLDIQPLNVSGSNPDYNGSSSMVQDLLSPLGLDNTELLFNNTPDFSNLTSALTSSDLLTHTDLLSDILPVNPLDMVMDEGLDSTLHLLDDTGSDSAISMGSGSPQQDMNETMEMLPFDGLEGATGGNDYNNTTYNQHHGHLHGSTSTTQEDYQYSCSSYGSPASVSTNCSTGSNDTEHSSSHSSASLHHIHHNHTYPTQPGQTPREVKKYAKKETSHKKGPQSRDLKRAEDLKLPFTFDQIVEAPVEVFNDMMTKTKLTDAQMTLMRDIRRRGKNKVAAQNCRKRKLDVLVNLEDEMDDMTKMRDKLAEERRQIDIQTRQAKEKYAALYEHIFNSLRDEQGRPYNPTEYSLEQSSDGNVFLVRKSTGSAMLPSNTTTHLNHTLNGNSRGSRDLGQHRHKDSSHSHKRKSRE